MWPILIAYGLISCFFLVERLLRQGKQARSFQRGQADRGSTSAIGAAFGLALLTLLVAPLLNWQGFGALSNERIAWGGIILMLMGLGFRIWAARVLGAFYTRTLLTAENQQIITQGPYRLIRHPGYLGTLLIWFGAGCATSNWMVILIIVAPLVAAYWYRMQAEEALLLATFPQEYPRYVSQTWRLIPYLY